MTHEKVGFVGIGLMGQGMAKNIVEKGYPLMVIAHRNRVPVDDLVGRGAVGRVVPKRHACATKDRRVRRQGSVGIARELAEGLGGVGVFHLLGMLAVNLLSGPPTKVDAANLADGRLAPFNRKKPCGDEKFTPLGQEVTRYDRCPEAFPSAIALAATIRCWPWSKNES